MQTSARPSATPQRGIVDNSRLVVMGEYKWLEGRDASRAYGNRWDSPVRDCPVRDWDLLLRQRNHGRRYGPIGRCIEPGTRVDLQAVHNPKEIKLRSPIAGIPGQEMGRRVSVLFGSILTACYLCGPLDAQRVDVTRVEPTSVELDAHYQRVLVELRGTDIRHLTTAQAKERKRLIQVLEKYRLAGVFGENTEDPGRRMPYFVDRAGRRCAVANLLDHSGMGALTEQVRADANHAWVAELADNRALRAWLRKSGLTLDEAARIQGPSRGIGRVDREPDPPAELVVESWIGPGDVNRPSPDPSMGSGPLGRVEMGTGSRPPTRTPRPRRGTPISSLPAQDWSTWWGWNRREFIHPRSTLAPSVTPSIQATVAVPRDLLKEQLTVELLKQLEDRDGYVRRAACVALGRLGGPKSVPALIGMLDDPVLGVRHGTILALGGTGSARAVFELIHIAKSGRARGSKESIGSLSRPLALIALGLANRFGCKVDTASLIPSLVDEDDPSQRRELVMARLLHQVLAPGSAATGFAREMAMGKNTPLALRCRAIEVLPIEPDADTLLTLIRALNGSRLEARRSAALALGHLDHKLALQPLMTAFELEGEHLTRAFLLLSIGQQATKPARDFLLDQLRKGRKTLKPWTALGLGLSIRKDGLGDKRVGDALRRALRTEKNQHAHGAYLIALGLSRDNASVPILLKSMLEARVSTTRVAAAEGLVLVGPDVARPAIKKRMLSDLCYYARSTYAGILGCIGKAADASFLAKALRDESHPVARLSIATALGMLDRNAGFAPLMKILRDPDTNSKARAQVIEGLGMAVSGKSDPELAKLYKRANFVVFPGWMQSMLWVGL